MNGYVLTVRPTLGQATIISDSGEMIHCHGSGELESLTGGDRVCVERSPDSRTGSRPTIRLLRRGSEEIAAADDAKLREFAALLAKLR